MSITISKSPNTLSPVFNPINFDCLEPLGFNTVTYDVAVFPDDSTSGVPEQTQYKKSNVYNADYFNFSVESILSDYLYILDPLTDSTKLSYTGQGWCKKYNGIILTDLSPTTELFGYKWCFNGSFDRNQWIDLTTKELVPNSATGSGRFLTDFTTRYYTEESKGTSDVFNGSLQGSVDYRIYNNFENTDYHQITFRNDNSLGLFNNKEFSVVNEKGIRYVKLRTFIGTVDERLCEGDIINYTIDPTSPAGAAYGTTVNGEWTIDKVFEYTQLGVSIYDVYFKVENTIPLTSTLVDNGTVSLVQREWVIFNDYYESGRYWPYGYIQDDGNYSDLNVSAYNKKLTFPTAPYNLRNASGIPFTSTYFKYIDGTAYSVFYMDYEHPFEVGDLVICSMKQTFSAFDKSYLANGRCNILEVNGNEIVCDIPYVDRLNTVNGQGFLYSPKKHCLVKKVRKFMPAILRTSGDMFELDVEATNNLSLPDKFIITLESGGPTYSGVETQMIVDNVDLTGVTSSTSETMVFETRTKVGLIEGLTGIEINDIRSSTYSVTICVHHQLATNTGYNRIFNYESPEIYYNTPVNLETKYYEAELEKVLKSDNIVKLNYDERLRFHLKPLCTKYENINISWINNYGVYDWATFDWKKKQSREYERNTYRKTAGKIIDKKMVYSKSDKELTDYLITRETVGTLDSDWVKEEEYNRLLEILESPNVYMWDNEKSYSLPIVIEIDSIEEKTVNNDKIFNLRLNYKISYNKTSIRI